MNQDNAVDTLNSLLRGEISATETYQQALTKVQDQPEVAQLRQLHSDHREAANQIRQHVHDLGGKPDQDSGAWGVFAKTVEGAAKIFGETSALKALKEGEEHGISSYESALAGQDLPAAARTLISGKLLPQCKTHISVLDRLMS